MMNPKVSIITVSYNAVSTIEQTILSVINQTYSNIEYIVIDGGSCDGTVDVLKKYEDKISYWVSEPDGGIYDAMNKGIHHAKGDYIGIINSDDWYELDALDKIVAAIKESPIVVFGNMMCEKQRAELVKPSLNLSLLKKHMILFHPSVFVKSDAYKKYGMFDLRYRISADWDMMLRLYENKCSFCYCNELISHFRVNGISSDFNYKLLKEKVKLRFSHGNYSLLPMMGDVLIFVFMKMGVWTYLLKIKAFVR